MAICNQCGEEIEFRYIDGRCVPIHPNGGWHCGFGTADSEPVSQTRPAVKEWTQEEFTRPTKCPICSADVFFIRHNGGCVWVDPPLGWPWPKHACFDQPHTETAAFSRWSAKATSIKNPKMGIITRISGPAGIGSGDSFVQINFPEGDRVGVHLQWMPREDTLIGALVFVSFEDKLLLHEKHGEIAFFGLVEMSEPGSINAVVRCRRCGAYFIAKNREKHDRLNCTNPAPPPKERS